MEWEAFGIAAMSSLDNLSFGVAYALNGVKIGPCSNGLVAALNGLGMAASMLAGRWIVKHLSAGIGDILAGSVYVCIGIWQGGQLVAARFSNDDDDLWYIDDEDDVEKGGGAPPVPEEKDEAPPPRRPSLWPHFRMVARCYDVRRPDAKTSQVPIRYMRWREAGVCGLALTFSNIAAGLAAGATGLDVSLTVIATFAASFLFLLSGQQVGTALRHGVTSFCHWCSHTDVAALAACFFLAYGIAILSS